LKGFWELHSCGWAVHHRCGGGNDPVQMRLADAFPNPWGMPVIIGVDDELFH
jgi:hypothetical protein